MSDCELQESFSNAIVVPFILRSEYQGDQVVQKKVLVGVAPMYSSERNELGSGDRYLFQLELLRHMLLSYSFFWSCVWDLDSWSLTECCRASSLSCLHFHQLWANACIRIDSRDKYTRMIDIVLEWTYCCQISGFPGSSITAHIVSIFTIRCNPHRFDGFFIWNRVRTHLNEVRWDRLW